MTTPESQQDLRSSLQSALHDLQVPASFEPPMGMTERILMHTAAASVRQRPAPSPAHAYRKYAIALCGGAVLAAVVLCFFALHTPHNAVQPTVTGIATPHASTFADASAEAAQLVAPPQTHTRAHLPSRPPLLWNKQASSQQLAVVLVQPVAIPHTPPPLALSSQERLLLALARNSSHAVNTGAASNSLGPNALLELPHEPLPPFPANSISSGEDQ